ncbi:MAG: nitrogen fixation protein NifB [Actinomycetota bacterium]|nr:nitrogen fixation protein NifB [Actinomycetota bacterium]
MTTSTTVSATESAAPTEAFTGHPCFDPRARHSVGRVHLPVAPRCNVQCGFCDRRSDCVSESRPGVTSAVLTPQQAAGYLDDVVRDVPELAVVGIAGPGDPFANASQTLETLALCRERHPRLTYCLATNGLGLPPHLDRVAALGVSHVTVTVNTVDPSVGARIYRWVRDGRIVRRGTDGAQALLAAQCASIEGLKARGITVKVNTILIPGVTVDGVAETARTVAALGADAMNCMPMYPVAGTPLHRQGAPAPSEVTSSRLGAARYLPQLSHCTRCRADAAGLIGEEHAPGSLARLERARSRTLSPGTARPYVAATSQEGHLVNSHLGDADCFFVFERTAAGARLTDIRHAPDAGSGENRWRQVAEVLADCRALLVERIGGTPRAVLEASGLDVHETGGLICEAAEEVFAGGRPAPVARRGGGGPGASRCGDGTGCG